MTRRRWSLVAVVYLALQLLAILVLPALSALVYGDLLPRLLAAIH